MSMLPVLCGRLLGCCSGRVPRGGDAKRSAGQLDIRLREGRKDVMMMWRWMIVVDTQMKKSQMEKQRRMKRMKRMKMTMKWQ